MRLPLPQPMSCSPYVCSTRGGPAKYGNATPVAGDTPSSNVRDIWHQPAPLQDEEAPACDIISASPQDSDVSASPETILATITEASLQTITPRSAVEALRSPQRAQWLKAMDREKQCHIKNGTFGPSMPPSLTPDSAKPIPADWVFKIKHRGGPIEIDQLEEKQFKARVVIRGQFMKEGLNFNDTFAPVAKPATVRALFAYAASNGCKLKAGDIETAFLSADMDCEVWTRMPPFWGAETGSVDPDAVRGPPRLLVKGVPGIPQGSRLFLGDVQHAFSVSRLLLLQRGPMSIPQARQQRENGSSTVGGRLPLSARGRGHLRALSWLAFARSSSCPVPAS